MINVKSQKGAITLYVVVTMLFLMIFLMSAYAVVVNRYQTQLETTREIAKTYDTNLNELDVYNSFFESSKVIPIYTGEQLAKVASGENMAIEQENGKIYKFDPSYTYMLMNDIDINPGKYQENSDGTVTFTSDATQWTPIGTVDNPFTGLFEGKGYTIKGLYVNNDTKQYVGLFGASQGKIQNVTVRGYFEGKDTIGGIAGYATSSSNIINCTNNVQVIGNEMVGGITGLSYGSIIQCNNKGIVEGSQYVGGVVGVAGGGPIKLSKNEGEVYCTEDSTYSCTYVGGISAVSTAETADIIQCENYGNINATAENIPIYAGGITSVNNASIQKSLNKGNIKCDVNATDDIFSGIGGISGCARSTIVSCYNTGNINQEDMSIGRVYSGGITGICGLQSTDSDGNIVDTDGVINNCYNTGNIKINNVNILVVGGIVGQFTVGEINQNYNIGSVVEVSANNISKGGVIGFVADSAGSMNQNYALEGTSNGAINSEDITGQAETKSSIFMQSSNLVDLLGNTEWKLVKDKNNNYPVLIWENGQAYTNYTYEQVGLVLWYDAIDNLGTGTHSTTTTTWRDLSGNNNDGNKIDGTWNEESLGFDGVDDYVDTGINQEILVENNEFTIITTINATDASSYRGIWGWQESSLKGIVLQFFDGTKLEFAYGNTSDWIRKHYNSAENILNKNVQIAFVYKEQSYVKMYINNEKVMEETLEEPYITLEGFNIGYGYTQDNRFYKGTMNNVMIYNRELTEEEIKHNYEIDKVRFNIE